MYEYLTPENHRIVFIPAQSRTRLLLKSSAWSKVVAIKAFRYQAGSKAGHKHVAAPMLKRVSTLLPGFALD